MALRMTIFMLLLNLKKQCLNCRPQGLNKTVMKKIPLDEISGLAKDTYLGGQRISFEYDGTFYQFFECGHAVVDYLQENLFV